ncbi:hypothetical protein BD779DRAFT_1531049 [Infundibulicybe gibba]|nr:hypothetical protein BD779DRAFT_1531049 [Infundibulicybe gibba]
MDAGISQLVHVTEFHFYAQDNLKRDVVIRLVASDAEQHRIHTLLMGCPELFKLESFPSVQPTLEVIPSPYNFSFFSLSPQGGALMHPPLILRPLASCCIS